MKRSVIPGAAMMFATIFGELRQIALDHGYSLMIHGSLSRDMDLVAVPWTDEASDPHTLAEAIRQRVNGHESEWGKKNDPSPRQRPHGRLAWAWYPTEEQAASNSGPYIDLSIMPRREEAMKERPIVFSDEMVRAILEGRKTMTRRVVKSEFLPSSVTEWKFDPARGWVGIGDVGMCNGARGEIHLMECPYGVPGDRLWVKETFRSHPEDEAMGEHRPVEYAATPCVGCDGFDGIRWTPALFMPRWASRITLEIVSVRVERVQDISDADCEAEGVRCNRTIGGWDCDGFAFAKDAFKNLWDTIYAKNTEYKWDANPWVWVIEFKVADVRLPGVVE